MSKTGAIATAVVFSLSAVIGLILLSLLCKHRKDLLKRRERRAQLRQCPRAEPFEPPVPFPEVVEASVVFSGQQEARRGAEEDGLFLTRVQSEMQSPVNNTMPDHLGIGEAAEDGNHLPDGQSLELLHGLPIDRRNPQMPDVGVEECGVRRPTGVMYRLRSADAVYGSAEYTSHRSCGTAHADAERALRADPEAISPRVRADAMTCEVPMSCA
ncbi:hypothetical protein DQ04_07621040 [Trypanosoma grayi]|uniref:hypothetical protein n=1 Tax=Trypanosoma grayi TaxID=71804 RepID=UPI0004F456E0|nr:hypothetical protein DQ04_07621040 [Trypanosoma grayi]KEG08254.1 hypothetical protein DQ04_07621040 [Trypanosoma grayi]